MIKIIKPYITKRNIICVTKQLRSGFINDGRKVWELENILGEYHNCYCVVLSNCTLSMKILYEYYKDNYGYTKVSIPDISQVATMQAAIGANLEVELLETNHRVLVTDTKDSRFAMVVNFNGRLCAPMNKCNVLISDSAQSILTKGIIGDIINTTAFSLGAIKNITAGIGGGILTKDIELYKYLKEYKNYGRKLGSVNEFDIISRHGLNYKMSDINAALAISQFENRDKIIDNKWRIYNEYSKHLKIIQNFKFETPWLIEVPVTKQYFNINPFRKIYECYSANKCLNKYAINPNYHQKYHIFLPSYIDIKKSEIQRYCRMVEDYVK